MQGFGICCIYFVVKCLHDILYMYSLNWILLSVFSLLHRIIQFIPLQVNLGSFVQLGFIMIQMIVKDLMLYQSEVLD